MQWVTVLDLGFAWTCWISPVLQQRSSARWAGALGSAIVLGSIGIDHLHHHNFAISVSKIKVRQQSWLEAYNAIDAISAPMRSRGETINLIYIKGSWFTAKRHLSRLRFDRLIGFDPTHNRFSVERGIGKGETYTPQVGDLFFTIDNDVSTLRPLLDRWPSQMVYQDPNGQENGRVYRIHPSR